VISETAVPERLVAGARPPSVGRRLLAAFAFLLPPLLAAEALFDRGFAYVGVPHTPAYITEIVLGLGLLAALCLSHPFRLAFETSPVPAGLLVALILWGGGRAVLQIPTYGVVTIRDYALCYYMLFALLTAAVIASFPGWLAQLVHSYRRFIPWLFAWSPVAILVSAIPHDVGPSAPGAPVSLLTHRIGDLEVQLGVAVAFLWLVPAVATSRHRKLYTLIGLLLIGLGGTQNRGGLVAAVFILLVAFMMAGPRRKGVGVVVAILAVSFVVLAVVNPEVKSQRRVLSFRQLQDNVLSLVGANTSGDLNNTVAWRSDLWKQVSDKTISDGKGLLGWGFGPNLGVQFAFGEVDTGVPLRSPHNSHLDVIARTGPVGGLLWVSLWATWLIVLARRRKSCRSRGDHAAAGVIEVLMLAAVGMLINAYFDPTLEAAPAAVFLWTIFGLGLTAPWGRGAVLGGPAPKPLSSP
jgi:hypothetical protein